MSDPIERIANQVAEVARDAARKASGVTTGTVLSRNSDGSVNVDDGSGGCARVASITNQPTQCGNQIVLGIEPSIGSQRTLCPESVTIDSSTKDCPTDDREEPEDGVVSIDDDAWGYVDAVIQLPFPDTEGASEDAKATAFAERNTDHGEYDPELGCNELDFIDNPHPAPRWNPYCDDKWQSNLQVVEVASWWEKAYYPGAPDPADFEQERLFTYYHVRRVAYRFPQITLPEGTEATTAYVVLRTNNLKARLSPDNIRVYIVPCSATFNGGPGGTYPGTITTDLVETFDLTQPLGSRRILDPDIVLPGDGSWVDVKFQIPLSAVNFAGDTTFGVVTAHDLLGIPPPIHPADSYPVVPFYYEPLLEKRQNVWGFEHPPGGDDLAPARLEIGYVYI